MNHDNIMGKVECIDDCAKPENYGKNLIISDSALNTILACEDPTITKAFNYMTLRASLNLGLHTSHQEFNDMGFNADDIWRYIKAMKRGAMNKFCTDYVGINESGLSNPLYSVMAKKVHGFIGWYHVKSFQSYTECVFGEKWKVKTVPVRVLYDFHLGKISYNEYRVLIASYLSLYACMNTEANHFSITAPGVANLLMGFRSKILSYSKCLHQPNNIELGYMTYCADYNKMNKDGFIPKVKLRKSFVAAVNNIMRKLVEKGFFFNLRFEDDDMKHMTNSYLITRRVDDINKLMESEEEVVGYDCVKKCEKYKKNVVGSVIQTTRDFFNSARDVLVYDFKQTRAYKRDFAFLRFSGSFANVCEYKPTKKYLANLF